MGNLFSTRATMLAYVIVLATTSLFVVMTINGQDIEEENDNGLMKLVGKRRLLIDSDHDHIHNDGFHGRSLKSNGISPFKNLICNKHLCAKRLYAGAQLNAINLETMTGTYDTPYAYDYTVDVYVRDSKSDVQKLPAIVDTGSSNLGLALDSCTDCGLEDELQVLNADTVDGECIQVLYGDSSTDATYWAGNPVKTKAGLSKKTMSDITFAGISKVSTGSSSFFTGGYAGILGLAYEGLQQSTYACTESGTRIISSSDVEEDSSSSYGEEDYGDSSASMSYGDSESYSESESLSSLFGGESSESSMSWSGLKNYEGRDDKDRSSGGGRGGKGRDNGGGNNGHGQPSQGQGQNSAGGGPGGDDQGKGGNNQGQGKGGNNHDGGNNHGQQSSTGKGGNGEKNNGKGGKSNGKGGKSNDGKDKKSSGKSNTPPLSNMSPLVDSMATAGTIDQNVFTLSFCGDELPLTLGGVDNSLFRGKMEYADVKTTSYKGKEMYGYWLVDLESVSVGKNEYQTTKSAWEKVFSSSMDGALIDSGTTELILPTTAYADIIDDFMDQFKWMNQYVFLNEACVTEDSMKQLPDVVLKLKGGIKLTVPPKHYMIADEGCYYWGISSSSISIIGNVALQDYTISFDKEKNRMGFAKAVCQSNKDDAEEVKDRRSSIFNNNGAEKQLMKTPLSAKNHDNIHEVKRGSRLSSRWEADKLKGFLASRTGKMMLAAQQKKNKDYDVNEKIENFMESENFSIAAMAAICVSALAVTGGIVNYVHSKRTKKATYEGIPM